MDTAIEKDLRSWSEQVLEVASEHLNGFPPCPYARKAWRENKVLVVETDLIFEDARKFCAGFYGFDKELIVVASYRIPDLEEFAEFVAALNEEYPSLHCMQFHPEYGAEDAELDFLTDTDWESSVSDDYCMVFIQDLKLVVAASDRLERLGYYAAYPRDEYEELVVNRRRRLPHGNEASCNEKDIHNEAWRQG